MNRCYIIDFDDSFTFNISGELFDLGLSTETIHYSQLANLTHNLSKFGQDEKFVIIFGPGPGHPDEYQSIFSNVKELMNSPNIMLGGICLGHQIIGLINNAKVIPSKRPVHGQSVSLLIPEWECFTDSAGTFATVQRYNSLTLLIAEGLDMSKYWLHEGECMAYIDERILTYQFHPESIGTSCRNIFFRPFTKFLI